MFFDHICGHKQKHCLKRIQLDGEFIVGQLPNLFDSIYSSLGGFNDYKSNYILVFALIFLIYSIICNFYKKWAFTIVFICGTLAIYDRAWYIKRIDRFNGLFLGSLFLGFLLFFGYERLLKMLNKKCRYKENKIWIRHKQKIENNFYGFFSEAKYWMFLDNDNYKNLTSVKSKILLRSLHNFTFLALISFVSVFFLDLREVKSSSLVYLIPIFFVIYQYNANQHWNQWKYCSDLYYSIRISDDDYNERQYSLAMDMIVLEMWANRTLYGFFKGVLEHAQKSTGKTIDLKKKVDSLDAWNLLAEAHGKVYDKDNSEEQSSDSDDEPDQPSSGSPDDSKDTNQDSTKTTPNMAASSGF
jgi:hypothetical protein